MNIYQRPNEAPEDGKECRNNPTRYGHGGSTDLDYHHNAEMSPPTCGGCGAGGIADHNAYSHSVDIDAVDSTDFLSVDEL